MGIVSSGNSIVAALAIAHVLSLQWQLKISIDLYGKSEN